MWSSVAIQGDANPPVVRLDRLLRPGPLNLSSWTCLSTFGGIQDLGYRQFCEIKKADAEMNSVWQILIKKSTAVVDFLFCYLELNLVSLRYEKFSEKVCSSSDWTGGNRWGALVYRGKKRDS